MNNYGHFNAEGTEFIITNPKTPRDFDNYIFNNAIYSEVQQTGVGYTMFQIGRTETTLLSSMSRDVYYNRDSIMNRLVYIRDNDTGEFWNLNWEPVKKDTDYFRCRHGLGYTILESKVNDIEASLRIFIPDGNDPVELWTIDLKNTGTKKRNLSVFVYYEFAFEFRWGFDAYGHLIYMHSWFDKENNVMLVEKHPEKRPHNYLHGFMASDVKVDAFDGSKDKFIGRYNKLNEPESVINGQCKNCEGTNEFVVSALQFNLTLDTADSDQINIVLGVADSVEGVCSLKNKYLGRFEEEFVKLREVKQKMINTKVVKTPDEQFDRIMNIWIKQQLLYGATWTRWGVKGYRDIVQHGFGITDVRPDVTKSIILQALNYQYSSGAALRAWDPMITQEYSDSGLWLIYALTNYIKETGDFDILDIDMAYLDEGSDPVIKHMEKALDYLEGNKGIHGLNLIKFGDWNDSLTAIGKEGRGESVWLSMAYATACLQLSELFGYLKNEDKQNEYMLRYESMKKAINESAWDGDRYIGCYSDSYRRIYSTDMKAGQIYLNTQSWAVISEVSPDERNEKMMTAVEENLLTPYGYLLQYPTFKELDSEIGRVSAMEPGIAENGTIYSHGNAFMIYALLKLGKTDKAYNIFKKVSPGYYEEGNEKKKDALPYSYTNCYYGPDHRHSPYEMEYSWVTGSVSWFYNVMHQWMLGIRKEYDGLTIAPQIPSEWNETCVDMSFRGKELNIKIQRNGEKGIILNGNKIDGNRILTKQLENKNELIVNI